MIRCSDAARVRQDSLDATAPPTTAWLLLEIQGPWGPRGLLDSSLSNVTAQAVQARADIHGLRVLLIRRFGRRSTLGPFAWGVVDASSQRTSWGTWTDPNQLLNDPLPSPGQLGCQTSDDPLYLVCTHGKHDTCCAVRGRPLAQAFTVMRPNQTWECTHLGGDRFAANVVVLPSGHYYGHVEPVEAAKIVHRVEQGRVFVPRLRGQSGEAPAAQAAQLYVRRSTGEDHADALETTAIEPLSADPWRVTLAGVADPVLVTRSSFTDDRGFTCAATAPGKAWNWTVTR